MRIELCKEMREVSVLAKALGSAAFIPTECGRAHGLATDSGEVLRGDVFLALPGKRHQGWEFAEDALARGASGIIAPEGVSLPEGHYCRFTVREPEEAVLTAAAFHRSHLSGKVIAISGSSGKTTLKEGLSCILREIGSVRKSIGNFNSAVGMPLSVLSMEEGDYYLLELGINHPGEMELMSRALMPDLAILTNVGSAHIGNFSSFDCLLNEKEKIADGITQGGGLLLPENLKLPGKRYEKIRIYHFGTGMNCDFRAENIRMDVNGVHLDLTDGKRRYKNLAWGLPGSVGVSFLSLTGSVAFILNVPEEALVRGLARAGAFTPRMRRVFAGNRLLINDTYNASPESMIAAIETMDILAEKRERAAVLGDILELGVFSKALHEAVGECVGKSRIDKLFTYGEKASGIAKGARLAGMSAEKIFSFYRGEEEELVAAILKETQKDAAILFKASRKMRMEEIVAETERKA